jgi:putative ABC transport system permease protein
MKTKKRADMLQRMLSLLVARAPMLGRLKPALRALLRRPQAERELDEELRHHIEQQTEQNIRLGMNPEEASYAALRAFGGVEQAKERSRDARGVRWLEDLWQDLRYGARMLWKNPGFTLVAVITLALGIGANTAIFSLVEALLLRPLPYPEPDRLVLLSDRGRGGERNNIPYPNFSDWRDRAQSFEGMASIRNQTLNLTGVDKPVSLRGRTVNWNFFHLLGVQPQLGRLFVAEDDRRGAARTALLSDGLWKAQFGGDPSVIGRKLMLDGEPYEAIGVLPPGFEYFQADDVYVPIGPFLKPDGLMLRGVTMGLYALGRLRPCVTLAQANSELAGIAAQLEREYPADNKDRGTATAEPLQDVMSEGVRRSLWILLSSVGFILLIACINVANLLLARGADRQKEMALRLALGAGRGRIVRQLLGESLLIALLGGAFGALLGRWILEGLLALHPGNIPHLNRVSLNMTVLLFTLVVSALTSVLCGLLPALHATRADLHTTLKEGGRTTAGAARDLTRKMLLVAEVSLAFVLLIGAGLLVRSMAQLMMVDPGFDTDNLLTMRLNLRSDAYTVPRRLALYDESLMRLGALPGVQGAAITRSLPIDGSDWGSYFSVADKPGQADIQGAAMTPISANYFEVMGMRLLKGRAFTAADTAEAPRVAVINETLARRIWPGEDPIGKRLVPGTPTSENPWCEVVGVVADVKLEGLEHNTPMQVYLPLLQRSRSPALWLVVRTAGDPLQAVAAVERTIHTVEKDLPVYSIRSMDQRLGSSLATRRLTLVLLAGFAALALLLAAVGIYGVISYSVRQRTHELGIRMALGAQAVDVLKLIIVQGLKLTFIGVAIGLTAALSLTRWMKSLLFEVRPTDPMTFIVIALLLIAVALLACWVPARRATKVDPVVALRKD